MIWIPIINHRNNIQMYKVIIWNIHTNKITLKLYIFSYINKYVTYIEWIISIYFGYSIYFVQTLLVKI